MVQEKSVRIKNRTKMNLSEQELNALLQSCKETMLEYEQTIEAAQKVIELQNQNNKHLKTIIQKQESLIENLKHQIQVNNLLKWHTSTLNQQHAYSKKANQFK